MVCSTIYTWVFTCAEFQILFLGSLPKYFKQYIRTSFQRFFAKIIKGMCIIHPRSSNVTASYIIWNKQNCFFIVADSSNAIIISYFSQEGHISNHCLFIILNVFGSITVLQSLKENDENQQYCCISAGDISIFVWQNCYGDGFEHFCSQ